MKPANPAAKRSSGRAVREPLRERLSAFGERLPTGLIAVVLLGAGLFFTASFLTGMGAFLGDAGRFAATQLFGAVGLTLAPLVAAAGFFLLIGRFSWRVAFGVAMVFFALCITFAAGLPARSLFVSEAYSGAGGIVGSGLYAGVYALAGIIGAVVVLALMYLFGASMISGVTFAAAFSAVRGGSERFSRRISIYVSGKKTEREERAAERVAERAVSLQEEDPDRDEKEKVSGDEPKELKPVSRGRRHQDVDELYAELEDGLANGTKPGPEKKIAKPPAEKKPEDPFEVVLPKKRTAQNGAMESRVVDGEYTPPPFSLLDPGTDIPDHDAGETSRRLTQALADLGVEATVVRAVVGPRVTRYEMRLGSGVKVGKIANLQQDIAYALAATEVRILAPIPGKSAVGVEVPNLRPAKVTLGDVFEEYPDHNDWALPVAMGKDIAGRAVFMNLAEMPHLLVAGTTGSGKSVMLNGLLTSLLLTTDPRRVKMVLIDPKRVEMAPFARIPHLITPVVTDVKKAANALAWAVAEMERRYEVLEGLGVRSLDGYNAKADAPMPYVVIVIDELADLMMTSGAKVEDAVIRIAQKARAVGIHLVVATQRPSVDVITGMIKANVPSRIAFAVSSQVDSRVILDTPGAEALLGMGDMLYKPVSASRPSRVQGAFISEDEVERIVDATVESSRSRRIEAEFIEEVTETKVEAKQSEEPEDDLIPEAANFVVATQQASVSAVQRRFRVGYSRAGRIIDALERKGVVGPYEGSKSRSVVASEVDLASIFNWGEDGAKEDAETPRGG
ncbi:FtsK/SpoIIIE family DNA translocase [Rubrobacter indicoceani]|uniref:FtsK/SpoIIIE family DNA translocase n=1 Tax=Rubrobacter indicoceani TaxID=2051957 RepID=UPI0013C528A1|nr:DNA translocase FtsK [Rubrobacter indicoceani]